MIVNSLVEAVEMIESYPRVFASALKLAVDHAGSASRLADETGLRRQSISLWAKGVVFPSTEHSRALIKWLCSKNLDL